MSKLKICNYSLAPLTIEGMKSVLSSEYPGIIIYTCKFENLYDEIIKHNPQVLIIDDYGINDEPDNNFMHTLFTLSGITKVIVYTGSYCFDYLMRLLSVDASGLIHKKGSLVCISNSIVKIINGEYYFDETIEQIIYEGTHFYNNPLLDNLSYREKQILKIMSLGKTNKEIAEKLFISIKTVETHKTNIKRKLGLSSK